MENRKDMTHIRWWHKPWLLPSVVGVLSFSAYVSTLPTTVGLEDSAEFVAAAATFGVPHPSGYPLYVVLGRVFAALPWGTLPWRVALLSAVSASGAIILLALTARAVIRAMGVRARMMHDIVIGIVLLQFAFSETWWGQAVTAEVYTLHVALVALIAYLISRWALSGDRRFAWAAALATGAALSDHLFLTVPLLPYVAIAGALATRRVSWRLLVGLGAVSAAVAITVYGLFALVPRGPDAFAMGDVRTINGLMTHVLRLQYGDVGSTGWNKFALIAAYLKRIVIDLGPLVTVLGFGTLVSVAHERRKPVLGAAVFAAGAVLAVPLVVFLRAISWDAVTEHVYDAYATMGMAFLAAAACVGAVLLFERSHRVRRGRVAGALLVIALAVIPLASVWTGARTVRVHSDTFPARHVRAMLQSLPQDAVFVVNDYGLEGDTELFILAYLQTVERMRPDVTIVHEAGIHNFVRPTLPDGYADLILKERRALLLEAALAAYGDGNRTVVTSYPATGLVPGWRSRATGYAFLFDPEGTADVQPNLEIDLPDDKQATRHAALQALTAHAAYNKAAWFMEQGMTDEATDLLVRAISLDLRPLSADYQGYVAHRGAFMESIDVVE